MFDKWKRNASENVFDKWKKKMLDPKDKRVLGIGSLFEAPRVIPATWRWRFLIDTNGL